MGSMEIRDEEQRYTYWDHEAEQHLASLERLAAEQVRRNHPLHQVFMDAIDQVVRGKGLERHGNVSGDFYGQPWAMHARLHGRGFLTGQAAKKLGEAASGKNGDAFEKEMLGAIVYAAMAILKERGAV